MECCDDEQTHKRKHLEKTVHMLFGRRYLSPAIGVAHVPYRSGLVRDEAYAHGGDDKSVNFQKYRRERWNCHLPELEEMEERFLPAAGRLDGGGAVAQVVREPGGEPHRQHEIHQDGLGGT